MSTRWWLLVDHCVLRNWDRILVRAVKGLIYRAGMVSICPLMWQRDVKLQQTKLDTESMRYKMWPSTELQYVVIYYNNNFIYYNTFIVHRAFRPGHDQMMTETLIDSFIYKIIMFCMHRAISASIFRYHLAQPQNSARAHLRWILWYYHDKCDFIISDLPCPDISAALSCYHNAMESYMGH